MYTIVFVTRYLDLLHPPSAYLILMKLFFISSSAYILYLMKVQFRSRYKVTLTRFASNTFLVCLRSWHSFSMFNSPS